MNKPLAHLSILAVVAAIAFASGFYQGKRAPSEAPPSPPIVPNTSELSTAKRSNSTTPLNVEPNQTQAPSREASAPERGNPRQAGYEAGQSDLASAFEQAAELQDRERALFVMGLFSSIAENASAPDAIAMAKEQLGPLRNIALQSIVAAWTGEDNRYQSSPRQRRYTGGGRYGVEVELASRLARSEVDVETLIAWRDAFSDGPNRSEITAQLAPAINGLNPANAIAGMNGWTDWEQERFKSSFLSNWSQTDPQSAWEWQKSNPDFVSTSASEELIRDWAHSNASNLIQNLDTFQDPRERQIAIEAIAASLAGQGTARAIDWVDSLATQTERDAGMQAVYEATPKGIGAMLGMQDGFPVIQGIVPGGAIEGTGIREGDMIVQSRESGGETNDLYGSPLSETVGLLRGAPGSTVELRILRENEQTGQLEEQTITVERDLLILDPEMGNHGNEVDSP
jgi:hypothetical protein